MVDRMDETLIYVDEDATALSTSALEEAAWEALQPLVGHLPPLDQAAAFIEIADYLSFCGREAVTAGRDAGATWSDVGQAFGISKQGAQQRFGKPHTWTD